MGRLCKVIAGRLIEPTSMTRLGSLPWVIKSAIDVARKPIARIPNKSKKVTRALKERKMKKVNLSLRLINSRDRLATFNTI